MMASGQPRYAQSHPTRYRPAGSDPLPARAADDEPSLDRSRLATALRRLGAVLLDGLLVYPIFLPIALVVGPIAANGMDPSAGVLFAVGLATVAVYVGLLAFMAYALVQMGQGRSPGKKLLGLRVVHLETGRPAGFWRMVLREVIGKWLSGAALYLGFLWILWDEKKQGWHDKIAGTVVVREDAAPREDPSDAERTALYRA